MAEESVAASETPKGAEENEPKTETVAEKEATAAGKPMPTNGDAVDVKSTDEASDDKGAAESADEKKTEDASDEKAADAEAADGKKTEDTSEPMEEETEEKPAAAKDEDAMEEDEKEEKPAEKPEELTVTGRGRRVRKPTQTYQPVEESKPQAVMEVPEGKGEKLQDIPNVVENFKKVTWSDPHLKMLHFLVFGGRAGGKKQFKEHLLQFSGLVYTEGKEEEEQDKVKEKMYKLTMPELKAVMDLVDIDRSKESLDKCEIPGKEAHCQLFVEWLEKPKASGKKAAAASKKGPAAKRKSNGSAKGSAKKAKKTTPAKKSTSAKKAKPAKKTPPAKKATAKSPSKPKSPAKGVDFNIPGVDIEKVREKVKTIVDNANREELTVKGVRKLLEDWLDMDLSKHKDAVRSIVMEVM